MSFNIRGFSLRTDGVNTWKNRAPSSIAVIRRHAPELIGLQEVRAESLATCIRELSEYAHILGPAADGNPAFEANAILFDPVRLELLDSGGFWLGPVSGRAPTAWGTRAARSATWARFRHLDRNLRFLHLNTHLDHISGAARAQGSELIVDRLTRLQGGRLPAVVTGDFNCRPGAAPYRTFVENGFEDAFLVGGDDGDADTFHGFDRLPCSLLRWSDRVRSRRAPLRIDWILFRSGAQPVSVKDHAILRDAGEKPGIFPSDHYPVLATLSLSG